MKEICKQLEEKGFQPINDEEYEAKNGDKYIHIGVSNWDDNIAITIFPYDELPITSCPDPTLIY